MLTTETCQLQYGQVTHFRICYKDDAYLNCKTGIGLSKDTLFGEGRGSRNKEIDQSSQGQNSMFFNVCMDKFLFMFELLQQILKVYGLKN